MQRRRSYLLACRDGLRTLPEVQVAYGLIGNSVSVPVVRWVLERVKPD